MPIPRLLYPILLVIFSCGCAFLEASDAVVSPAPTVSPTPPATPVPTLGRQAQPVNTTTPLPSLTPADVACIPIDGQPVSRHTVQADLDYTNRTVTVRQQITFVNLTDDALSQLVLSVKPAARPGVFDLDRVVLEPSGRSLLYRLEGQRLTVDLPQSLAVGCRLTLTLAFELALPPIDIGGVDAFRGYLGYSPRQINLGHWLPIVAPRQRGAWIVRDGSAIGEQDVLETADWDVTLTSADAPESLRVAAPGQIEENRPGRWRFVLRGGRDFSLSLSDQFILSSQMAANGIKVELYSFEDARIKLADGVIDSAAYALDVAAKSAALYADLFGAYPYERLVVVQGDFPDGMEFSGLVFVGGEYFRGFGGPTSYLMMITVHEIAHQWWYAKVGNDAALTPWLDEALATYSEYAFIEAHYPALRDWWWGFRVDSLSPQGFVDSTVYEFNSRRAYINAVYLRGVRMLQALREDLGTEAFYDWLRRYAEAGAGRIMSPEAFWGLLTPEQLDATAATRERYLRRPQIVVIPGSS